MDLRARLSLPTWDSLTDDAREAAARELETVVPRAKFDRLESFGQGRVTRKIALFDVDGVKMALVPGGEVVLGFEPKQLDQSASVAWERSFREGGHVAQQVIGGPDVGRAPPADMVRYLTGSLSPRRSVKLAPFLLERSVPDDEDAEEAESESDADPHLAMVERVRAAGFRIPSSDEWEHACSGGERTLFRWGNAWPVDTDVYTGKGGDFDEHGKPNAFGLTFGTNPYQSEIVTDPEQLHGGDGGCLVCGESGPISWITFASAYRYRLGFEDTRDIWFDQTQPRRALSIFPTPEEDVVRRYVAPNVLDDADLAIFRIREALSEHDGFVLEGEAREQFARRVPDLEAVAKAHPKQGSVQASVSRALRKLGKIEEAEVAARRGLAIERTFDTITALVATHRAKNEIDAALELLEEAATVDPTDASSSLEAGDLLAQQGRYPEAMAKFDRALAREPGSGYAQVMAHYTRFKTTGDTAEVEALGEIALGPAKDVPWVNELYREIAGLPPKAASKAKKTPAKKKAPAKKKKAPAKKKKKAPARKKKKAPARKKKKAPARKKKKAPARKKKKALAKKKKKAPAKKKKKAPAKKKKKAPAKKKKKAPARKKKARAKKKRRR